MKTFFLLVFFALVASTGFAQYTEAPSGDVEGPSAGRYEQWDAEAPSTGSFEQCENEHAKLYSCGDYLMDRCTPKEMPMITWPWKWGKSSCEVVRNWCCQQLEHKSLQCRCKAILRTIQDELSGFLGSQGQKARVVQMAKRLPSECKLGPRSCNIPITSGYYW